MTLDAARELAKWRREGPVWYITFVVEGYEETFVMRAPGRMRKKAAVGFTKHVLAHRLKERRKYIHLQAAELRG